MYCKYCGKEIADDSIFCRYCGGKQEESIPSSTSFDVKSEEPKKKEKVIGIPTIKINLSDKQKMWCEIYAVWVLLNFFFVLVKGNSDFAKYYFFPFEANSRWSDNTWDLEYYDFTEFLFYVILLPSIVFLIYKYKDKIRKALKR